MDCAACYKDINSMLILYTSKVQQLPAGIAVSVKDQFNICHYSHQCLISLPHIFIPEGLTDFRK